MDDEKLMFFKMNEVSSGLSEEALQDIASNMELVRYEAGELIHSPEDIVTSVTFVAQGRVKHAAMDAHGNVFLERIYTRGEQFGGLTAALAEPLPVRVNAVGPVTLLTLEYQKGLDLTLKYPKLRANLSKQIARNVRKVVFGDKKLRKPTLIAMFYESPNSRELTDRLVERLQSLGEHPCVFTDRPEGIGVAGVPCRSIVEAGQVIPYSEIHKQIHEWSTSKRVFFDLVAGAPHLDARDILMVCEQVYWCVKPNDWQRAKPHLESIKALTPAWREKISVVWLIDTEQNSVPVVPELRELALEDIKVRVDSPLPRESKILANGIERLVNQLRGIRIGLALGGGGGRGMAHIGVLKALEEHGIVVDMIAGTSAGAMTGTLLANGMEHDYCANSFVNDLTPSWLFRHSPKGSQWFLLYKYRRGQFDPMLRKYLGDLRLEQLAVPVHTVAVDLVSGVPVVRSEGDAVHAILESINLPVLSVPICREGQALVDGGLVNNVPANVLVDHGCSFVIAVSVTAKLKSRFGRNHPTMATHDMKAPSFLQTLLRSFEVQSRNMNSIGVQPADFVIEPDATAFDLTEFSRADEISAVGYQATLQALPQIKSMLSKLDTELFD